MKSIYTADTTLRDTYIQFIRKADREVGNIKRKLNRLSISKDKCYEYLTPRKGIIADNLHIELDNYDMFTNGVYDEESGLVKLCNAILRGNVNNVYRTDVIQLVKLCSILKNEYDSIKNLEYSKYKLNLTFTQYRNYLFNYFCKVHKVLLDGDAYKFTQGIGTCFIFRFKFSKDSCVDFNETNKAKQRLIEQGLTPYSAPDAKYCEENGLEYDGVQYVVKKNLTYGYKLKFARIRGRNYSKHDNFYVVEHISYRHTKYRNMSNDDVIKNYNITEKDIPDMQLDLRSKLALLIKINPGISLRYNRKYGKDS